MTEQECKNWCEENGYTFIVIEPHTLDGNRPHLIYKDAFNQYFSISFKDIQ